MADVRHRVLDIRDSDCFELGFHERLAQQGSATSDRVEVVVSRIRQIVRTASLEFALRVGAVIIEHLFEGDTAGWRSKGSKAVSFRRLVAHPDLPLSAVSVSRCVALFELCERLNAPARWQHLGASHLRLVLGLPHDAQERLLTAANAKRWTVKAMQEEVQRQKPSRPRGGRRDESAVARNLQRLQKALEEHRDVVLRTPVVSPKERLQSVRLIEETRRCLERLSLSVLTRSVE